MEDDPDYVFWTLYGAVDSSDYLVGPTAPGGSIVNINASLIGFTRSFGAESEGSAWPYYNAGFDWNLDGSINDDITPFGANYGTEWTWSNTVYAASSLVAFTATSYDAAGRIVRQMSSDANAAGLVDYRATYDFAGQVTSRSENGVTRKFAYDAAGQVIGETAPNFVAQTFETTEYDYDDAGNRQAVNRPGTSNDRSYTMDVGSGSTPHANRYLSDGVWTFEYDGEGNLLAKDRIASAERWEYTYDHRNHLVRAEHTTNGTAIDKWVEYVDDAHGNRVARIADLDGIGNGGASTVRYTLDGFNPSKPVPIGLENFAVWSENAADVSSSLITRYMHGDGVDELLGRWDAVGAGSGQFWILSDSLGSVRGVVEVGGTLVNQLTYDAFGTIVAETNPTYRGNFAYTGRLIDNALGLQTNGDRIYDPDLGRWLQNDPIGFAAGDANLYRYVGNGATNLSDPSGMTPPRFVGPPSSLAPRPVIPPPNPARPPGGAEPLNGHRSPRPQIPGQLDYRDRQLGETRENLQNEINGAEQTASLAWMLGIVVPRQARWLADVFDQGLSGWARHAREQLQAMSGKPREECPTDTQLAGSSGRPPVSTLGIGRGLAPVRLPNPNAARPAVNTSLPDRVTQALPEGQIRTPAEVAQARNFFERNRQAAQQWWEQRTGQNWPSNATHAEHPRPLANGGDPLYIEPGFNGPNVPHMITGPDGLTDFQRWGQRGGRPPGS